VDLRIPSRDMYFHTGLWPSVARPGKLRGAENLPNTEMRARALPNWHLRLALEWFESSIARFVLYACHTEIPSEGDLLRGSRLGLSGNCRRIGDLLLFQFSRELTPTRMICRTGHGNGNGNVFSTSPGSGPAPSSGPTTPSI
jgi:hypothetical protein